MKCTIILFLNVSFVLLGGYLDVGDLHAQTYRKPMLFITTYVLRRLAKKHILFGHQGATDYGHGWYGDLNRSEVKSQKIGGCKKSITCFDRTVGWSANQVVNAPGFPA